MILLVLQVTCRLKGGAGQYGQPDQPKAHADLMGVKFLLRTSDRSKRQKYFCCWL